MFTLGSAILIATLIYGAIKHKEDYLLYCLKVLIVFSVHITIGYFIKLGSFDLSYADIMMIFIILVSLFCVRIRLSLPRYLLIILFGIVIFLGYLLQINNSTPIMIIPIGGNWDAYFFGSEQLSQVTLNTSYLLRIMRLTLFLVLLYIFDEYVLLNKERTKAIKLFILKVAYFMAWFGIVEQIFKLAFSSNLIADVSSAIFGIRPDGQLTVLFERGGLPVLQGLVLEPGHYVQSFLPAILILFLDPLFNETQRLRGFILFGYILAVSGSFAGMGILLLLILLFIFSSKKRILIKSTLIISGVMVGILVLAQGDSPLFEFYLNRLSSLFTVEFTGTSEAVRMTSVNYALDVFRQYPLFGIGFGATTVSGLIPTMLVNFGILGTFLWFMIVLKGYIRTRVKNVVWLFILIPLFYFIGGMRHIFGIEILLIFTLIFRENFELCYGSTFKPKNIRVGG